MSRFSRFAAVEVAGHGMGYYAFVIGDDGHMRNRIDVLCDNDDEAKRCAGQLVDENAVELWQEARKVTTLAPKDCQK